MNKNRILLIYGEDESKAVDNKARSLQDEYDPAKVYHIHEDGAVEFYKEATEELALDYVFFTENVSAKNQIIFSQQPYDGTKMS